MILQRHSIQWGGREIEFSLVRAKRKRVAIEVNPDQSVLVRAPTTAELEPVLGAVRSKAKWILRQKRHFEQFVPRMTERQMKSGETHLYLGRHYRLKVHATRHEARVKLWSGYIHLWCRPTANRAEKLRILRDWYATAAKKFALARLEACLQHRLLRTIIQPKLRVQELKRRWGSFTPRGALLLNPEVIRAPRRCVDYVLTHELCHAVVRDHSPAFFRLLGRVMPDWQQRKHYLERLLA